MGSGQATDEGLCDGRVQQQLVSGEVDVALRGIDNSLGALFDGSLKLRGGSVRDVLGTKGQLDVPRGQCRLAHCSDGGRSVRRMR